MGKKLPHTPSSQIRSALRQLWLRSRERQAAIKRDGYACCCCGAKQSKAKGREVAVEVHHIHGVDHWAELIEYVRKLILVDPGSLVTLCRACHQAAHDAIEDWVATLGPPKTKSR